MGVPGGVSEGFELTAAAACAYLRDTGRLPVSSACQASDLGGGVSCAVVLVESPMGRWVLKQALPRLRVAASWLADASRSRIEARCLEWLGRLLPPGHLPDLLFEDGPRHLLAVSAAPEGTPTLKQVLLGGRVPRAMLAEAGSLLGRWQAGTRTAEAAQVFADLEPFRQLRISAYYDAAAAVHPEVAAEMRGFAAAAQEMRVCLVHGDYSPKNMLVLSHGLWLLDFEVAHFGCRAFDPAFFLNHLALKCVHLPRIAPELRQGAADFWSAYREAAGWSDVRALEREVLGHLGCLLLARVDGKSPAEYLVEADERDAVRLLGRGVLRGQWSSLAGLFAAAGQPSVPGRCPPPAVSAKGFGATGQQPRRTPSPPG